jgi:hypothetical protein
LELIQREKDYDNDDGNNWKNKILNRHGCLCAHDTDLKLLVTGDTDVELRIVLDGNVDICVPSFDCLEVRARRKIVMPMKTSIRSGLYKPHPVRYTTIDLHRMLKKVQYVLQWLKSLETTLNDVLRMIANPLWDIDENTSAFDFTHFMQLIQNAITIELPEAFVAHSFCFSIQLFPDVRAPFISETLIKKLTACINVQKIDQIELSNVFRHSIKYINFILIEYIEFKECLLQKISQLKSQSNNVQWNHIEIVI